MSQLYRKSLTIHKKGLVYLYAVVVRLYFSVIFLNINLDNFLLRCPLLKDSSQLISALIKTYECVNSLRLCKYYCCKIVAKECPSKMEHIAAAWYHYCSFVFHHCLPALPLLLLVN